MDERPHLPSLRKDPIVPRLSEQSTPGEGIRPEESASGKSASSEATHAPEVGHPVASPYPHREEDLATGCHQGRKRLLRIDQAHLSCPTGGQSFGVESEDLDIRKQGEEGGEISPRNVTNCSRQSPWQLAHSPGQQNLLRHENAELSGESEPRQTVREGLVAAGSGFAAGCRSVLSASASTASRQPAEIGRQGINDLNAQTGRTLPEAVLQARDLWKAFVRGATRVEVLQGLDLEVAPGEFLAVVGPSGSGKSTLLHLLATLDRPDRGEIFFRGRRIDNLSPRGRDRLRNRHFGMVFQMYHLLPELSALENVMLPLMIGYGFVGVLSRWRSFRGEAMRWLEAVGLGHRAYHKPRELSGGEMQRAAIARALVHRPDVLFADEPTGNLDRLTGREILELLCGLNQQQKLTIVMVTHDPEVARSAHRIMQMRDGRLFPLDLS